MKRILHLAAIVAFICLCHACNRLEMPEQVFTPASENEAPSKYVSYQTEFIDVPVGSKSLVYQNGTLVATCYHSGYVVLPKVPSTKAIGNCQIVNLKKESDTNVAAENHLDMVVAFEDSKTGDHDYNDLVIQAHIDITNMTAGQGTVKIDITPVALGATNNLGLGLLLTDAEGGVIADQLITDNCRAYMFDGDEGFINTRDTRKQYATKTLSLSTSGNSAVTGIAWYLAVSGQRLYASNYFQPCLDDSDAPQGLVFMNIRSDYYYVMEGEEKTYCGNDFWQYPAENVSIDNVYPDFYDTFISSGNFSIFANPTGRFFNAISATDDGLLTSDCLYEVYIPESDGNTPQAIAYYDNTGKAWNSPQQFDAIYNPFNHQQDNFILEFSTEKGNAIDFERGDVIEAKILECIDHPFKIGNLTPDVAGKTLEGYCNDKRNWWRIQDNFNHNAISAGKSFPLPLIIRISKAGGIEWFVNGQYEQALAGSNEILASILTLGTDQPLYFGLFGNYYSTATYEYVVVTRNCQGEPIDETIRVTGITVQDKSVLVDGEITLTANVLPKNATNPAVTWSSSNTSIATVNPTTGQVTGIAEGTCTITATSVSDPTVSGSCTLTVCTARPEVIIWEDTVSSQTDVAMKQLTIISSGVPADDEICFENGDYIEVKFHRNAIEDPDKDIFYVGSANSGTYPYLCVIGHKLKNCNIYVIPSYWWDCGNLTNIDVDVPMYIRFGCKADGTPGCGSFSRDGETWQSLANSNDIEAQWQTITNPSRSPFIIRTARSAGFLSQTTYDYVKIVRGKTE